MGNNQLNSFASSAIQQLDHFVLGSKSRFNTQDYGFLDHMYYHTTKTRNVYKYNNIQRWVKDINLLDFDNIFIPTNSNQLHWMMFIIVPAERHVECYDSRYEANVFHLIYQGLSIEKQAPC
jgi:Ulp1 family protease